MSDALSHDPSIAIQAADEPLPNAERSLELLINEVHAAVERNDTEGIADLRAAVEETFTALERELRADSNRTPKQAKQRSEVMRSLACDAFGDFEGALRHAQKAAELSDSDLDLAKTNNNLNHVYRRLGDFGKAVEHANVALRYCPTAGWAIANWFMSMVAAGRLNEALDELERPSRTRPMDDAARKLFVAHVKYEPHWFAAAEQSSRFRSLLAMLQT